MTQRRQVYVCEVCGNMVEVLRAKAGTLVCCAQPMRRAEENTVDASREKHLPAVERKGGQIKVAVGSVAHPMAPEHFIEWIEVIHGERAMLAHLKAGDPPAAAFDCPGGPISVRAYCNLHGLWKTEA